MNVRFRWRRNGLFRSAWFLFIFASVCCKAQTLHISDSTSSTTYGQSVTFSASLSEPGITGSVQFYIDGSEFSTASLTNSNGSFTTSSLSAGSHTVTAKFESLTSNSISQTVYKATLTVTANASSRIYGAANPTFTASYSGFVNGNTSSVLSGSPSLITTATSASAVGTYVITASAGTLSAANYNFTFVNGTLTVNKAILTVSVNATSSTYGTTPGPFSASYGGFVNGDTTAVLSGAPSLATTATSTSAVGSYSITIAAGTLAASNYSFSFVNGTLTITQANTVTSINTNLNPSTYGQTVAFSASINTEGGTPTGSVTFKNGSTTLATVSPTTVSTTNLLEYSQQLTASTWSGYCSGSGLSNVTANTTDLVAPDGTQTATKFVMPNVTSCGVGGAWGEIATVPAGLTTGQSYTVSAWLRGASGGESVDLALNDCTSTSVTLTTSWQRYSVTYSAIGSGVASCATGARGFQFLGDYIVNETFYIWGTQLENASSAGPYVATKSSSATGKGGIAGFSLSSLIAGPSSITAAYAGDTNTASSTSATLTQTVNTTVLTVAANAASSTYGTVPGPFAASYSGFANGDTSSVLSGAPSLTTTATASSPVGTYPITSAIGTLAAANYTFSFVNGTLTVNKATPVLTLTWSPSSPILNQAVTFTCSATVGGQPVLNGALLAFSLNGTNEASVPTVSGSSTWSTSSLNLGQNTVGCSSGDSNYNVVQISSSVTTEVFDSGTITLTVNGTQAATTTYSASSTPDSIAAGLVAGVTSGSPVTLSQADATLYMTAKTTGATSDLSYSLQTSWNQSEFTEPSFVASPATGSLEGGAAQNASTGTIYSYSIPSYVYGSTSTGYDAVGNVVGYTDRLVGPNGASTTDGWLFPYDTLNRLTGAAHSQTNSSGQTSSNYCWSYDAFGNRTLNYSGACTSGLPLISYNTNNQLATGLQGYDAAGNVTADANAGNSYLYDADGRICAAKSQTANGVMIMTGYVYNAEGERVAKGPITTMSCDPVVSGLQTASESDYVLGPSGEQLTEMGNGNTTWVHTNVFAAGELFATYDHDGLHFYANDWLGNRRVQTDYAGVPEQTCTNLPFGDSLLCSQSTTTPTEHHFTGKERDTESGNDYFGARYYASSMGRWLSPDWSAKYEPVPYAKLDNPQSLNLYGYVLNNPLSHADPDGHQCDTCQKVWTWLTSSHSASSSASGQIDQGSASRGAISQTVKLGAVQASASAKYGLDTSASASASAAGATTTINEGTHSTTQMSTMVGNASAAAGVSGGGASGVGVNASAGAGINVLTASQTETVAIGPVTITAAATGNVGLSAGGSLSAGTNGFNASANFTPGYGGALTLGISWGGVSATGGASVKGTVDSTTGKINIPEIKTQP